MPFYGFRCKRCGNTFEQLVFASETPACPSCESVELDQELPKPAPAGKTAGILAKARRQAAREGHFSNYGRSEIKRR